MLHTKAQNAMSRCRPTIRPPTLQLQPSDLQNIVGPTVEVLTPPNEATVTFPPPTIQTCAAGVILHKLCRHWLELVGADFLKQMTETWGSTFSSTDFDQALPIAFSRQNLPDLAGLFEKIGALGSEGGEVLLEEIETDSPLLNSKASARALAIKSISQHNQHYMPH